jgi:tagaturonate reductase
MGAMLNLKIIAMLLNKENLARIPSHPSLQRPAPRIFDLPEKVLQFGTGVFIRGLIDYFIDKANNAGQFNGRVVMVKSTAAGTTVDFTRQDGLYTLLMKSVDGGVEIDEKVICAAVSRTLDAATEWGKVRACASNPDLSIIISNTTEIGIVLAPDDKVDDTPPSSFPGKLLAFLWQRYRAFGGSKDSGMVIVPTELIPGNGDLLKSIVQQLAQLNKLPLAFIEWLNVANDFCNSLVDRIVPGKLPVAEQTAVEAELGYEDKLLVMAESFGLWAIETSSARSRNLLSFSAAHPGIHLVDDITKFRELKLRLLNGSHNLSCALGYLAGFTTVKEAMANKDFDVWMQGLILEDIAGSILSDLISKEEATAFGLSVLSRYRNPHIDFQWLDICVQDTSKIRIRAIPIILQHYKRYGYVPRHISMGMAAYILFMRSTRASPGPNLDRHASTSNGTGSPSESQGSFTGRLGGREYPITDDFAADLHDKWQEASLPAVVDSILGDQRIWGADLASLQGFADDVVFYADNLDRHGFFRTLNLPDPTTRAVSGLSLNDQKNSKP